MNSPLFEVVENYPQFDKETTKLLLESAGLKASKCPDCQNGYNVLLTSRTKCPKCNGRGRRLVKIFE